MNDSPTPLLAVRNLKKYFQVQGGLFGRGRAELRAVDGVSFDLGRGKTLGLVGRKRLWKNDGRPSDPSVDTADLRRGLSGRIAEFDVSFPASNAAVSPTVADDFSRSVLLAKSTNACRGDDRRSVNNPQISARSGEMG